MGAEVDIRTYPSFTLEAAKARFLEDVKEAILDYGRAGYTGTIAEHDVLAEEVSAEVETADDAEDYIGAHAQKWEASLIVRFTKDPQSGEGFVIGGLYSC